MKDIQILLLSLLLAACATEPVHTLPLAGVVVPPPGYLMMCATPETWLPEDCPNARPHR